LEGIKIPTLQTITQIDAQVKEMAYGQWDIAEKRSTEAVSMACLMQQFVDGLKFPLGTIFIDDHRKQGRFVDLQVAVNYLTALSHRFHLFKNTAMVNRHNSLFIIYIYIYSIFLPTLKKSRSHKFKLRLEYGVIA
jgi:hypothetical protein